MNDYSLKALKGGIREYINILIAIYNVYKIDNSVINRLNDLYESIIDIDDINILNDIKKKIIDIQNSITIDDNNNIVSCLDKDKLSSREKSLISRGYNEEDILKLCSYSDQQLEDIADIIISDISNGCNKVSNPICIFIGGQPGCGKSTNSTRLRDAFSGDGAIEIGIDNYRAYHPYYLKIEDIILKHWENRKITINDSPGNDIADFTHRFAGDMCDYIVDKFIKEKGLKYNLIIEWGMRTPEEPIKMMRLLKLKGYKVIVNFVVVDKDSSYKACILRADAIDGFGHIVRRIPKSFHDLCVSTLPSSCNKIYEEAYLNNSYITQFVLLSRDGNIIWNTSFDNLPGDIYNRYLNKKI